MTSKLTKKNHGRPSAPWKWSTHLFTVDLLAGQWNVAKFWKIKILIFPPETLDRIRSV